MMSVDLMRSLGMGGGGRALRRLRGALLLLVLLTSSGCGYQLIGSTSQSRFQGELAWRSEMTLAPELVSRALDVALYQSPAQHGDVTFVPLDRVDGVDLVAVVEDPDHVGRYQNKKVTYLRVRQGRVVMISYPREEPAPDPEFLMRLYRAAVQARSGGSVIVNYNDPRGSVSMSASSNGKCHVRVRVLEGGEFGGQELFEVKHNICIERLPIAEVAAGSR